MEKKAKIALEDGTVFEGISFGYPGEKTGEIIFNTGMTGYPEVLTDPSYKGQIVTMTYPLIGNYGVNDEDFESAKIQVEGFVVKENSRLASNWRSQKRLDEYLKKYKIIGIEGVDTRALTKHIRLQGAMKVCISTEDLDDRSLIKKAKNSPGLIGRDLVREVACKGSYAWNREGKHKVVVIDCGVKYNILRELVVRGCQVKVVPAKTTAQEILALKPDGVLLSNGPGDPAPLTYVVDTVKKLIDQSPITHASSAMPRRQVAEEETGRRRGDNHQ
ncbi:MAG TPA: carbamoyl phosphate synthase small subunit, partial [Elusimicrobia bacterium]|nr:carbamoyl phosphate synthase small subunit [Elusimicrobiota bacterium]